MTTTIDITLDKHTNERLKRLGATRSRSPAWLMRFAIQQFLDREENYERERREDLERWKRFRLLGQPNRRCRSVFQCIGLNWDARKRSVGWA